MKGTADALLAILPKKGKSNEDDDAAPESGEVESDDNEGELAAAGELASAVKSGDAKAVLAAFKDLMETCGY